MAAMKPDAVVADPEKRSPGRPRSTRADEAIIEAVLDLVAEGATVEALSIEAVAARAGVGKATIYRRWANKEQLIVDAVAALKGPVPEVPGRSVREDLVLLVRGMRHNHQGRAGKIMPCLVPEIRRNPQMFERYQAAIAPRKEVMKAVLRRGTQTGELRADLDIELAALMLNGPTIVQSMLNWDPTLDTEDFAERLVNAIIDGIARP